MKKEKQSTIILGGGLTGLSAAYHGGYTVYEGEGQVGGTCISPTVDGYTFDLGIHVLHTKNKYVLRLLQDKMDVNLKTQTRKAWIYSSGKLTRYPFQANTFGLPLPLVKSCLISFVESYCKQNKNSEYYNYEQWLLATFGETIAKHFMIPYSEKFWTVHPRQITTEWLGNRIPLPSLEEVIEGALADQKKGFGPNATFRYPKKTGISAIPDGFYRSGIHVINNKKAVKIDLCNKEVFFSDGTKVNYKVLISTIPLPELTKLTSVPKNITMESRRLKYNSILCVNLGINKDKLNDHHWIYYHEKKYSFFRISFLKNFASTLTPRGKSSITAEISYSKKKPIDKENIADTVVKNLIHAKVLTKKDKIDLVDVRDIPYGYVIYDYNRVECLKELKKYFKSHSILCAGRYGNWEYQWMDDAILDGKKVATEAKGIEKEVRKRKSRHAKL